MQRKFFAWILAAALIINLPAVSLNAAEEGFTDVSNHWAKEIISKFTEQGIITGYNDGTFRPDAYLKRAEAVTLLNKFFNITQSGYPNFTDVKPEDWYYFQVGAAHERGYVNGYPDGSFKPNNYVTRIEALIMLYILLGAPEHNNNAVLEQFKDNGNIPEDKPLYRQIVAYMASNGILNEYPEEGALRINDLLTRAEALSLLNKISDMIANTNNPQPETEPELSPTPEPSPAITQTPAPELTITPVPADNTGDWPSPQPPGTDWYNTTRSALTIDPSSSFLRSGSGFYKGGGSGLIQEGNLGLRQEGNPSLKQEGNPSPKQEGNPSRKQEGNPSLKQEGNPSLKQAGNPSLKQAGNPGANYSPTPSVDPVKNSIPKDLFTLINGFMDIQENGVIISDSDSAYLNREYTLPKGIKIELRNSTLILMYNLNVTDENDLIGDRYSEIIEQGGFFNIGGQILPGGKNGITPDTYYYDIKKGKWRAMK